jgi:Family of unknown function (DUF6522)
MTQAERDGSGFVVSAALLAEAFRMTEDRIRQAMRDGSLTSICEAGVDADTGRWRLTFRHADRACRFTVDEADTILSTSHLPIRARPSVTPD